MDAVDMLLKDYLMLMGLPKSYGPLLKTLLKNQTNNNLIPLNSALKRIISKEINKTAGSLDNMITKLVENDILIRIDRGLYKLNSELIKISKLNNKEGAMLKVLYFQGHKQIQIKEKE